MTDNYTLTTINTAATSFDLTTVARAKTQMGITDTASDAWLAIAVTQASRAVAQFCNREFALQTYQDVNRARRDSRMFYMPNGRNPLRVARAPLVSVTSVVENDVTLVAGTDYEIDYPNSVLYRLNSSNDTPRDWPAYKTVVVYQAGWTLPSQSTSGNALLTYAPDVEDAVIRLIRARWYARDRDPLVKSEQVDGIGQFQYWVTAGSGGNLPPDVVEILGDYRIPAFA